MYVAFWAKIEPQTGRCRTFWQVTDTERGALDVLSDVKDFENTLSHGVGRIEHASEPEWLELELNENWGTDK
tara:strand:- start:62 stop:277 length:216 start_codon:yes stop_codon:yes gene_type:complete